MKSYVRRLYIEKSPSYDIEAKTLLNDLKDNLHIKQLKGLRIINRYDILGLSQEEYVRAKEIIFGEKNLDLFYDEEVTINEDDRIFAIEYLSGQYDQRADSAIQCVHILTEKEKINISNAKVIILSGLISEEDFQKVKEYCINPVDSKEASLLKPESLNLNTGLIKDVEILHNFIDIHEEELEKYIEEFKLAMTFEDLKFCRSYFKNTENRNPTITEIKVIDTYWSDHCRHTTFMTEIEKVSIEKGIYSEPIKKAYESYLNSRKYVYGDINKSICLMDMAVIGMKELRKDGFLRDLDESDEINACSIEIDVDIDEKMEKWLLMFKNETHNHPTEIEPFGGAATCLGGAIRDPLSGRTYVYQAMRLTGSGDPRKDINETLKGKLPQRKITLGAAKGYSSYGNQIGLATGYVTEIYDEDFVAKRMEIGAVIGAAPKANVYREKPKSGDLVILLGGKTGRDGLGGATGSSKEHNESSILNCNAEVQKGNPPEERKLQRLFRNSKASTLIKKCNDFGAGGVSVAVLELADGLSIDLDLIPKKYEGLDGTELAISESQERMAVVIARENREEFLKLAEHENIEATVIAKINDSNRAKMFWREKCIFDISRDFLNTNGVQQHTNIKVTAPKIEESYFRNKEVVKTSESIKNTWLNNLRNINVCSKKGLVENFDSTIGANTVLMPFGGKYQNTPSEGMVAKIPVLKGETNTGSIMTCGYNSEIGKWSPFHGAVYSIIEAVSKVVAMGGDYRKVRLSLQEYFERLGKDEVKWGKPFSALLGAYHVQKELCIPAIGGKDSMSGTFKELSVPPTLVAFAVDVVDVRKVISPEFKKINSKVILIPIVRDVNELPDFNVLKNNLSKVRNLIHSKKAISCYTVKSGGIAEAISKMCFGNKIGFNFNKEFDINTLFSPDYGSLILELDENTETDEILKGINFSVLGLTQEKQSINIKDEEISLEEALSVWEKPLETVFTTKTEATNEKIHNIESHIRNYSSPLIKIPRPKVCIPIFPGTNCEYDSARAFEKAGGTVESIIFRNLNRTLIEQSIDDLVKAIKSSQIIMIPGGFSAGDEPDGSGKFIATVFRNERIKEAVMDLLKNRDGLMLGICNGFQALIKLGLVPYGEIRDIDENSPTLTYNKIGRHVSTMVRTKVVSTLSPWFSKVSLGDMHTIPVSHGEGRFIACEEQISVLAGRGQIATQYVDFNGNATYDILHNPNGSYYAVEGITSPDGRVLGKMAHSERIGENLYMNIPGEKDQMIFQSGIDYFK